MAKKKGAETSPQTDFDILDNDQYVASFTDVTSSNASDEVGNTDLTGDKEADKILAAAASRSSDTNDQQDQTEDNADEETEGESDEDKSEEESDDKKDGDAADDKNGEAEKEKGGTEEEESEEEDKVVSFEETEEKVEAIEDPNGWKEVAKALFDEDLEVDDFDSFKQKYEEKLDYNLAKFKPETQRFIKFTEAGGAVEDFMEPLSKIDALISLPQVDLVDKHLTALGWNDETKRQAKLDAMVESGELEVVHAQVLDKLQDMRKSTRDEIIDARIKADDKHKAKLANVYKDEAKKIKSVLDTRKDFMGTELKPVNIEKIVKKYEAGEYEPLLKDPNFVAEFLLYKEYGKTGMQNLKAMARNELKLKHKEKFHNIPPAVGGKAGSIVKATPSGQAPEGNWDVLEKEKV
jgi:hypothetical protein